MKQERILVQPSRAEFEERRSRFIGIAFSIESEKAFREELEEVRRTLPGATHYCWAYQIGLGNTKTHGASDDGEPRGTAGRPILEVLKGSGITQCGVCVVRYYGGTQLGTGGLVRAYAEATKKALGRASTILWIPGSDWHIDLTYETHSPVKELCRRMKIEISDEVFDEKVALRCFVPWDQETDFLTAVIDLTRGQGSFTKLDNSSRDGRS